MKSKNFAAFILSHGRPDRVYTYRTLIKHGYTGDIYIILDNEDDTIDEYRKIYKDKVIVFDKLAISKKFDEADNFDDRRTIVYARNACWDIAESIGVEYFIQLDDDYTDFRYKTNGDFHYIDRFYIKSLDLVFDYLLEFYKSTNLKSLAIAQGGDFIGGVGNGIDKSINQRRKCMNSFICSTQRRFEFVGRINEDVNTYTYKQSVGDCFLTFPLLALQQKQTQSNPGGMSSIYLERGTYIKSFYTIIFQPSSVKIGRTGNADLRLHHSIDWRHTVPMIISEDYKK